MIANWRSAYERRNELLNHLKTSRESIISPFSGPVCNIYRTVIRFLSNPTWYTGVWTDVLVPHSPVCWDFRVFLIQLNTHTTTARQLLRYNLTEVLISLQTRENLHKGFCWQQTLFKLQQMSSSFKRLFLTNRSKEAYRAKSCCNQMHVVHVRSRIPSTIYNFNRRFSMFACDTSFTICRCNIELHHVRSVFYIESNPFQLYPVLSIKQ